MERLNEQQLQTLMELPYGKKYASIRVAAEEEWLKWVAKFKVFHSTMYKLKDWE